nr:MAG TPA: hypothetical protein [Caudoviricetes sp.]
MRSSYNYLLNFYKNLHFLQFTVYQILQKVNMKIVCFL